MAGLGTEEYKFKKGDTLKAVAKHFGHQDDAVIWKFPDNKTIVAKRKKPDQLQPGDVVIIPPNEKQKKELEKKLAELNAERDRCVKGLAALKDETDRVKQKIKVYDELIEGQQKTTEEVVAELEKTLAGMKGWATGVDAVSTIAQLGVSLGKICTKGMQATKLTGAKLVKANKEMEEMAKDLAKDPVKDATVKLAGTMKDNAHTGLAAIGIVAESWDKMTSPSFWANTVVQMTENGKSWSEAVSMDVGQDIEDRIKQVKASGAASLKKLTEERKAFEAQLKLYEGYRGQFEASVKQAEKGVSELK